MWNVATSTCSDCTDAGRVAEAAQECHNKLVAGFGSHKIDCRAATPDWVMLLGCGAAGLGVDCNVTAPVSHSGVNWRCYDPSSLNANQTKYIGKKASDYCMPRVDSCAPPPPPPPPPPAPPPQKYACDANACKASDTGNYTTPDCDSKCAAPPAPAPPPPSPPSPPPPPVKPTCNPGASPPEMCPGGKACPQCGKPTCPCPPSWGGR